MNKNIFWFIASIVIFMSNAFNEARPEFSGQELKQEAIRLYQKTLIDLQKIKGHIAQIEAKAYRQSIEALLGGAIIGHFYGRWIDRVLGLNDCQYTVFMTAVTPCLGYCAVQLYYILLFREVAVDLKKVFNGHIELNESSKKFTQQSIV
jgi:hypothetical protein